MKLIEIETKTDSYACDTCGSNWAEGGKISVDGKEVYELEPFAACFDSDAATETDLLIMGLAKCGIFVTVDGNNPYFSTTTLSDEYERLRMENSSNG